MWGGEGRRGVARRSEPLGGGDCADGDLGTYLSVYFLVVVVVVVGAFGYCVLGM